jgi:ribosome-binding protein aMBF1 (putative translation factor)
MSRAIEVLNAALLRIQLAQDAMKAADQAIRSALRSIVAEQATKQAKRSDEWPEDPVAFGALIRRAREDKGWTRSRLAQEVELAMETIRNAETARHRCTDVVRAKLIKALLNPST